MGNNQHLKRHSAPICWPVKRKNISFIAKPKPGSHKKKYVTSLVNLLRDVLNYAETSKEVKLILNNSEVLVNGVIIKDIKFPIGLFDVLELKKTNEKYTIIFDEYGKLKLIPGNDNFIYLKVLGKKQIANDKYQLNFMNGFNLLVSSKLVNTVKVGDTVLYDYNKKKISSIINVKEKVYAYLFDGKFIGQFGLIKGFTNYKGLTRDVVTIQIGDKEHDTCKDYIFAVGNKKEDLKRFN